MQVYDNQGREITADRIIAAAREAGLRLERGMYIRRNRGCCCAVGSLVIEWDPTANSIAEVADWRMKEVSNNQFRGLTHGFEGFEFQGDDPDYLACHAIGAEVYRRRHEAGAGRPQGRPTTEETR